MKPRPKFLAVLLLALSLPLLTLACSDDPTVVIPPEVPPDDTMILTLVDEIVIPIVEALNLAGLTGGLNAGLTGGLTGGLNGPAGVDCSPLAICGSGSAESCPGSGAVEFNFTSCLSYSTKVDGSILLTGTSNRGTATVDVTLDGTAMTGTVAYSTGEACFLQTYALAVETRDFVVGVTADLEYCTPTATITDIIVPNSGVFVFSIPSENRDINLWFYDSETTGTFSVNVRDTETSENILFCNGVLFGGLDCEVPTPE